VTYTSGMSDATTTTPAPVTERTEAQIIHEMCVLSSKLTMLQFELKRLRNPTGKTLADLKGIWAGQNTSDEEIEASKLRFRDDAETA
jgi:hypothetical protein